MQSNDGEVVLGDIITSIDGTKVANLDDVYRVLDKKQIGDTVQVEIYRGSRTQVISVKLMALPAAVQGRPAGTRRQ
jgi:S1-C subfamily serine protease